MQELQYTHIESYKYELSWSLAIKLKYAPKEDIYSEWVIFFKDGTLMIKKGFKWDGASGPTIDGKENFRAALIHDALYYLLRKGLLPLDEYRELADKSLHDICEFDGMNETRTDLWHAAVRLLAEGAAEPTGEPEAQDKMITYEYEDYNI